MEQTDEELYSAYILGSADAFKVIFERHKDKIFNFSLRLINNHADAEDVVSETFLQLFHKRYQVKNAKLTTWLYTVARNGCISRLRSVKHTVSMWFKREDGGIESMDLPDVNTPSPQDSASHHDMAQAVKKALAKIPLDQREAIILREYENKDYQEIADIMGCSLANVKVLIFRGREGLRGYLSGMIKEEGR